MVIRRDIYTKNQRYVQKKIKKFWTINFKSIYQ